MIIQVQKSTQPPGSGRFSILLLHGWQARQETDGAQERGPSHGPFGPYIFQGRACLGHEGMENTVALAVGLRNSRVSTSGISIPSFRRSQVKTILMAPLRKSSSTCRRSPDSVSPLRQRESMPMSLNTSAMNVACSTLTQKPRPQASCQLGCMTLNFSATRMARFLLSQYRALRTVLSYSPRFQATSCKETPSAKPK